MVGGFALWNQPILTTTPVVVDYIEATSPVAAPIKNLIRQKPMTPKVMAPENPEEFAVEKIEASPPNAAEFTMEAPIANQVSTTEAASARDLYISKLTRALNAKKKYPEISKRMRQQGRLKVRFLLERDGRILNAELIEQTNFTPLNEAAKNLLTEIKKFDPFPNEVADKQWAVTVPIEYLM